MSELHGPPNVSANAKAVWALANVDASSRYSCYPKWWDVHKSSGLDREIYLEAFEELCHVGIIATGVPSTIEALGAVWPLGRQSRPAAYQWIPLRHYIFERDDFTCSYCGERGGKLECDHIIPVSRGGSSEPENLTTACFSCNRAKRGKLVSEWRQ